LGFIHCEGGLESPPFIADSILLCKLRHQKVLTKLKAKPVQFGAANPSLEAYAISIEEMNCGSEVR